MLVELAVGDLFRGGGNGIGELAVDQLHVLVHEGGRHLHEAERPHDRLRHPLAADAEVLERALGLGAPVAVGDHFDRAERVGFGAGGGFWGFFRGVHRAAFCAAKAFNTRTAAP